MEYRQAVDRENILGKTVADEKAEFDRVNLRSFEYQTLKREAEGDTNLYEGLMRTIKEAIINSSVRSSSIRIAPPARPPMKPVFPSIPLNVMLAAVAALLLGCGAAILSDLLDNTIRDSEQAARTLPTVVLGSLPVVKDWLGRLCLLLITSPSPAKGKSTIAVRLAMAHADQRGKTLFIDGDLWETVNA